MDSPRPTQKDVARKAGVTQATVSLALRDHPSLAVATRARVRAIATELGYTPDPFLSGLSAYRKRVRPAHFHATLGWLSNYPENYNWKHFPAFRGYFEGATARAAELGYQLEEHRLNTKGMTPGRMERILTARNISGLLMAPQPRPGMSLEFSFKRFSAVTFGYTLIKPQLHLVTLHQFRSMEAALRRLQALGYRRPGLAINEESDHRAGNNWSAAFWSEQRTLPPDNHVAMFLGKPLVREDFLRWFERHRPDVVLAIERCVYDWLLETGLRIPEDVGFALLTVPDNGAFYSGIWENPCVIGAKAVEFLIDLMHRSECGQPEVPLCMLVAGTWVDGKTVRVQTPGKAPSPSLSPGLNV